MTGLAYRPRAACHNKYTGDSTMAKNKDVIVDWAKPNEWIPLRCSECGALFSTKNYRYDGAKPVRYAIDYALDPDPEKAKEMSYARARKCKHGSDSWQPDQDTYLKGKW